MAELPRRSPAFFALALLVGHLGLLSCFGHYYAKIAIPIAGVRLYPTDLVMSMCVIVALREIVRTPGDTFTRGVLLFNAFGVFWLLAGGGLGGSESAGTKAFSFFLYSAFYFVVRAVFVNDEARWRMLRVFAFGSAVASCIGLVEMKTGSALLDPSAQFEVTSTGSIRWLPGEFTSYGMIAALLALVSAIAGRTLSTRNAGLLAIALIELTLTQQRSGFLALTGALLATALFLAGSTQSLKRLVAFTVVATFALAAFILIFGDAYVSDTIERVSQTGDFSDSNIEWRLLSWYDVFDGIRTAPLGHGFAAWDFMFTAGDPLTGSHNSFLDLAYRIGVPGLAVFLALPVILVQRTRRIVQRDGVASTTLLATISACMIAYLIFCTFNVVLETPYISVLFWILLGLGAGALHDRSA